ncbi:N-acetylglutamate synthase [Polyplosphaeria fusca]|uniref:Amino-acid acetyltransferase, mitochondrial n=1 Tax=Polyplosphaeria fusca TaxID=682080 RepID=A0A9P4R0L6_9PLEO|nr:N-acetylglutamate synthase [Polyplosphaeria fusca]
MFISRRAQWRGWGRATKNTLSRYERIARSETIASPRISLTATSIRGVSSVEPGTTRPAKTSSAKERHRAERDQLISSLKESPGKRDAKNFLKHFDTPNKVEVAGPIKIVDRAAHEAVEQAHHNEWRLTKTGVNLGNLYEPTKAVQNNPVFTQQPLSEDRNVESVEVLHISLVKLRQPQALDDETMQGLALTLTQMVRLGVNIAVVVDCDEEITPSSALELSPAWEATVREQVTRIVDALEQSNGPGAFEVSHVLSCSDASTDMPRRDQFRGGVEVKNSRLLFNPLEEGIIPVVPPIAFDSGLKKVRVHADDVVLALTRDFAGITPRNQDDETQELDNAVEKYARPLAHKPLLDRVLILDPLGGIPSEGRADGAHVFVNLEAEYQNAKQELEQMGPTSTEDSKPSTILGGSNPISKFAENEVSSVFKPQTPRRNSASRHAKNLDVVNHALRLLPPSSSALIITPTEAAISSLAAFLDTPSTGVRTRRSKNPLIHNLLTDKPMVSSSLPAALMSRNASPTSPTPATFLKKGIPVTIIPPLPWQPPSPSHPSISLESDPRIDFPRLVHLIEDSFRRKLNVQHYLDRIRGRIAGIIIAGNYEGGAICTWEPAPPPLSYASTHPDSHMWIPYLDKFAVLTSSQGTGGVADIVWGALTRSAFPEGVVWRSRSSNPVNKWYFERAVGSCNLEGGEWTMFWTTEGVVEEWAERRGRKGMEKGVEGRGDEGTRWEAYVGVCKGVRPSWMDGGAPD